MKTYNNIKVKLSPAERTVDFDEIFNESKNAFLDLVGRKIGKNSNGKYSFSPIYGGQAVNDEDGNTKLSFENGGYWNFSSIDPNIMNRVYHGLLQKSTNNEPFAFGMKIDQVYRVRMPKESQMECVNFVCRPGIIVRTQSENGALSMISASRDGDVFFDELEEQTKDRLIHLGFDPEDVETLQINEVEGENYKRKSAKIFVGNAERINRYTEGSIEVVGKPNIVKALAHIGLGEFTHMGFGYVQVFANDPNEQPSYYDENSQKHNSPQVSPENLDDELTTNWNTLNNNPFTLNESDIFGDNE